MAGSLTLVSLKAPKDPLIVRFGEVKKLAIAFSNDSIGNKTDRNTPLRNPFQFGGRRIVSGTIPIAVDCWYGRNFESRFLDGFFEGGRGTLKHIRSAPFTDRHPFIRWPPLEGSL
jgi:hypothetical protein